MANKPMSQFPPILAIDIGGGNYAVANATVDATGNVLSAYPVIGAGEAHIGSVGGNSVMVAVTPTITALAYAAANNIGGIMTITAAMRISNGSGLLQSILIKDKGNQKAPLDILIFNQLPTGVYTDHAAMPAMTTDNAKVLHRVAIAASDYVTVGGIAYADPSVINRVVAAASGSANLYAVVQIAAGGAPTPVSTTDLEFDFYFIRD